MMMMTMIQCPCHIYHFVHHHNNDEDKNTGKIFFQKNKKKLHMSLGLLLMTMLFDLNVHVDDKLYVYVTGVWFYHHMNDNVEDDQIFFNGI